MKKILAFALSAAVFTACNDTKTDSATVVDSTTTKEVAVQPPAPAMYTPGEGDLTYREKKLLVWRNGVWVDADDDITLDNGYVVYRNGEVQRDDYIVVLNDGEVVTRTGNFFTKTGEAIDDAWDATKRVVKKAGQKIKKGVRKIDEKLSN